MKLNKIITLSLSLVLAPALNAQTVTAVDTAKGLARAAVFQASRFVAGALAGSGLEKLARAGSYNPAASVVNKLASKAGIGSRVAPNQLSAFIFYATAGLAPQGINRAMNNFCPPVLSWLKPTRSQTETSGRVAFWAGMVARPVVDMTVKVLAAQFNRKGNASGFGSRTFSSAYGSARA